MSIRLIVAAAFLAAVTTTAPLAAAAHDAAAPRTITVTGQGEATGRPDHALVSAGVQTQALTVIEAAQQNQAIVERIMQALDAQGVAARDIRTADYNVWPEQRHDPRNPDEVTISGYRVSNVVQVMVRDIDRVGEVLGAVTNAGANTIHGVNFGITDPTALEARARVSAMANARDRAAALAELAGEQLGPVQNITLTMGGGQPVHVLGARMEMAQAAPPPGIAPGELTVTVMVHVSYGIL